MATRQEIQIAQDLIRFINIINDFFDCSVDFIRANTDVGLIKDTLKRTCQNIYGYRDRLLNFLANPTNKQMAINGLTSWGVDLDKAKQELLNMLAVADYINTNVDNVTDINGLNILASYIEANVPKLPLVRKA